MSSRDAAYGNQANPAPQTLSVPLSERLMVNAEEAGTLLGISADWFRRLVREGKMPQPMFRGRWSVFQIKQRLGVTQDKAGSHNALDSWMEAHGG